jgi:hypothetical protein
MTPAACARCGAFASELTAVVDRVLCRDCVGRLTGQTLYSGPAVTAVGVLLNPTPAAVMLALNHHRLGDPKARGWAIVAAVLAVVYLVLIQVDLPNSVFLGAGMAGGFAISQAWNKRWPALETAGFKRRNPWWVVLATLGVLAGLIALYAVAATALGRADG